MYCVISSCYTLFLFEGFKELFFLFSVNRVEMSVFLSLFSHWSWKVLTELRETWGRSMFGATFWHPRKVLTSTLVVSQPWCAVKHRLVPMLLRHEATLNWGITGHVKHYPRNCSFFFFHVCTDPWLHMSNLSVICTTTYTNESLCYFPFSNTQFLSKFLQLQKSWRWVRIKLYIWTLLAGCHAAALTQGWLSVWRWEVPWYLFVCSYIGCAIVLIVIISINLPSYTLDCMMQPWRPAKTMTELD
jgi:hypothetical protein